MTCILVDGDEKSRGFESTPTANRSPPAMTTLPELTRSIFENERMASKQLNDQGVRPPLGVKGERGVSARRSATFGAELCNGGSSSATG
jgi:hypothetical protein